MFYRISSSSSSTCLFYLSAILWLHRTKLNQNRPPAWRWLRFDNACPKSGVYPPLKAGGPKPLFRRLRNLMATLTAYVYRIKKDIHNHLSALKATRGLLHRIKMSWTFVHKRLKIEPSFYLPSVNPAFYFIASLRRRRLANRAQPHFQKNWGPQKLLHLLVFSTTLRLNGEYLRNETWHRQSGKDVANYKESPTLSQNFVKDWLGRSSLKWPGL